MEGVGIPLPPEQVPRKGALALCSLGKLGLILSEVPVEVTYSRCFDCLRGRIVSGTCTCQKGLAWTGIYLLGDMLGKPWCSRTPRVVGHIMDIDALQAVAALESER